METELGRRPGRKRKNGVDRYPGGQIKRQDALIIPFNTEGVRPFGDERMGNRVGLERVTDVIDILVLTKSQRLAGQEFARLHRQCSLHAYGSPNPHPATASLLPGHGHAREQTDEDIEYGRRLMKQVARAADVLVRNGRRGRLRAVVKVCLDNSYPTPDDRPLLLDGLNALVELWRL